jgi:transcriptional regulator with XRE-family HTH domain
MTKNTGSTDIKSFVSEGAKMDLLRPEYTDQERGLLSELQSYINVSRALLHNRLSQGLTQDELGRAAGTKQSRISELEAMRGNPRFDTLDRIARVLDLVIDLVPRRQIQPVATGFRQYGGTLLVEGTAYSAEETSVRQNESAGPVKMKAEL